MLRNVEKRGVQAARLPLEPGGTRSKFSYRSHHAQHGGNATEPAHLTLACVLLPPAGNWVRFFCSIPPLFVLSHGLPMINTRANWLRLALFYRCQLLPPLHWPLATFVRHSPRSLAVRRARRGQVLQTLPRWLPPATDCRIAKNRMGLIWPSEPSILIMHRPGDSCGKSNPFPTRRRPTVDHSLVAGGARTPVAAGVPAGWPSAAMPALVCFFRPQAPESEGRRAVGGDSQKKTITDAWDRA